jgi:hypothetical protein
MFMGLAAHSYTGACDIFNRSLYSGGLAQLARACDWQSQGQGFDSPNLHNFKSKFYLNALKLLTKKTPSLINGVKNLPDRIPIETLGLVQLILYTILFSCYQDR